VNRWYTAAGLVLAGLLASLAPEAALAERAGSLAFYPPLGSREGRPPLVAFVTGSFWGLGPADRYDLERLVVRPLRSEGLAVALLRHQPAPDAAPPDIAAELAGGLAALFGQADELGIDPARVYLAGHGSGAQLAALLALDGRYLEAVGLSPARLAGVIPISGLYDLASPEGVPAELLELVVQAHPDPGQRADASPLRQRGTSAPPMLVLVAEQDIPGFRESALALAAKVRQDGQPEAQTFVIVGRDHGSILSLGDGRNAARRHLLGFVGEGEDAEAFRQTWAARRYWRAPALTTAGFWERPELIREREADDLLLAWLRGYFAASGSRARVGAKRYQAIDLEAWLDAAGAGSGRWLVTESTRGEQAVLDLEAIRPYEPVVVVGIDDQRNLFEVVDLYNTQRRYTWKEPEPETWILARPLGAFVHFRKQPPRELVRSVFGMFALSHESLRRVDEDPLAALRTLDPAFQEFLIQEKACVSCHSFRGAGTRAGHIRASDGQRVGGFALPLEEYPAEAWRRYVFEQAEVAAEIGATPVDLTPEWQRILFDAVVAERR
jgi:acetyl esterase/lipase